MVVCHLKPARIIIRSLVQGEPSCPNGLRHLPLLLHGDMERIGERHRLDDGFYIIPTLDELLAQADTSSWGTASKGVCVEEKRLTLQGQSRMSA